MRVQIVAHAEVPDDFDVVEGFRKLDSMFQAEALVRALGFSASVEEITELPEESSRSHQLRELADSLFRVGVDDLPPAVAAGEDSEPLELRISLSISGGDFPSVAIDELMADLEQLDDGEISEMGPIGLITMFDAYGQDNADPVATARNAASVVNAAASQDGGEPQAEEPEPDHEEALDNAEEQLQNNLSKN